MSDSTRHRVVVNDEEQYSIWVAHRELPRGWRAEGTTGSRADCLAYIERVWTDIRPRSPRERTATRTAEGATMSTSGGADSGWESAYSQHDRATLWDDEAIPVLHDAIPLLREHGAGTVADIGCGDGRNIRRLSDAGFVCLGVDVSPTALERARDAVRGRGFLLHAAAGSLPLPSGSVDAVTCLDVLPHVPDPDAAVAEFGRVVAPGGLIVVNLYTLKDSAYGEGEPAGRNAFRFHDTVFRFYERDDVERLFAGWRIARLETMSWMDPPHGEFRPTEHFHESWVVVATPPR